MKSNVRKSIVSYISDKRVVWCGVVITAAWLLSGSYVELTCAFGLGFAGSIDGLLAYLPLLFKFAVLAAWTITITTNIQVHTNTNNLGTFIHKQQEKTVFTSTVIHFSNINRKVNLIC